MKLSAEGSEFFFYYSLLGNDITSEPFHNLLSPSFEPERSSVRIRSSKQVLHTFLSQEPDLEVSLNSVIVINVETLCRMTVCSITVLMSSQIHLCCGSRSLGSTNVSLSVLALGSVDLESKAAAVEGAFILRPPNGAKHNLPADLQPTVGVSVTLRSEAGTQKVHVGKVLLFKI